MINTAIRKVPTRLKEDAFQAGCVGLVIGLKNSPSTSNPDGYVYKCIRSEVFKELAALNGIYSLDAQILINLMKYKRARAYGQDPTKELGAATIKQLEKIINTKGWSLNV
jgi:DNA-directed RNA polymerase specialized sigma subunit